MATIILVVHILLAIALVGVILIQRSEGGGLGIGGNGGGFYDGAGDGESAYSGYGDYRGTVYCYQLNPRDIGESHPQSGSQLCRSDQPAG